jgi:hypothetical protein
MTMADPTDTHTPTLTERAREAKRQREAREAEALRANLRRRKAPDGAVEDKKDAPRHG